MSDLIAASSHECFRLGVMTGLALSLVIGALAGWLLIVAAESDWSTDGHK